MSRRRTAEARTLGQAIRGPTALVPLMQTHPERAAELILAALLREPGGQYLTGLRPDLGIVDDIARGRSLPEGGPLLAFFVHAPDVALTTLMRLVDHATAAWSTSEAARIQDEAIDPPFEILLNEEEVVLVGDFDVMHWHRGAPQVPEQLASALMALEQYLYRKLDAGESVDDLLRELMTSRSVAIFGVLVEVACYEPDLLRGPLAPLATSAALILADRQYKHRDHGYLLMAFNITERRRLEMWHRMSHRTSPLDREILQLAVAEGVLVDELEAGRYLWARDPNNRWRFIVAQMDPANYVPVDVEDEGKAWILRLPSDLQNEVDSDRDDLEAQQWWLTAPMRLAQSLKADAPMTDDEAQDLWDDVQQRLSDPPADEFFADGVVQCADVECGTAAVLLVRAPAWVERHANVTAFCHQALVTPFMEPPPTHIFDSSTELVDLSWDGFAAIAIPLLWEREPQDSDLRECAARLATHRHLNTVQRFLAALTQRSALPDDLRRLEVLSLHWARYLSWVREYRQRRERTEHWPEGPRAEDLPDIETPTEEAFAAFVDGSLTMDAPPLGQYIDDTPAGIISPEADPIYRLASAVDISYLMAAHTHLLSLPDGLPDPERARRLDVATQMSTLFAAALVPGERGDVEGTPSNEERTLHTLLAEMIVHADGDAARPIWQPILAAGGPAHYWVSSFIRETWRAALAEDPTPPEFVGLVKEMMAFGAEQSSWSGFFADELELELLCLNRFGYPRMEERHRPLLAALQPEWNDLAARQVRSSYSAHPLVAFLGEPAAADIVETGLQWLVEREHEGHPQDDDLDEQTATTLAKLAGRDPRIFRDQPAAAEVLAALVARLNPVALQLNGQLGGG